MTRGVTVVIPTYRRPGSVGPLVKMLLPQRRTGDAIVVVWQGAGPSPQGLPDEVACVHQRRPNLPAARNRGIASANSELVLFLDDDVVPAEGLLDAHRACYDDPAVAGVAGSLDDPLFDRQRPLPCTIDLSRGDIAMNFACPKSQKTVSAKGANMSFRTDALRAIGGFDGRFSGNALWEEVDCCLRLIAAGYGLWYCAGARALHRSDRSGGCRDGNRYRYLFHQFANTAYFGARFCLPGNRTKWFTYWKYRLEFLSRAPGTRPGRLRHDPLCVLAAAAGALAGIGRYAALRRRAVDRSAVHAAVAALNAGGAG